MNFEYSEKVQALQKRLSAFMDEHIYPNEKTFYDQIREEDRWQPTAIIEELKPLARAAGSLGRTSTPASPRTCRLAPTSVATTGRPAAIASNSAFDIPSARDGNTTTSSCARYPATLAIAPSRWNRSARPTSRMSRSSSALQRDARTTRNFPSRSRQARQRTNLSNRNQPPAHLLTL